MILVQLWPGKYTLFSLFKNRIEQVSQVRRRKLVFKGVRISDEGKYTCKTNADSTVCEMIVERKSKVTYILNLMLILTF